MRYISFLLCFSIILSACTGHGSFSKENNGPRQSFDTVGSINLLIKDYDAKGDIILAGGNFLENKDNAEPVDSEFGSMTYMLDLTSNVSMPDTKIQVTSDSTIVFNEHTLVKHIDKEGKAYYFWEEYTDELNLAKTAIKLVRNDSIIKTYSYFFAFKDINGTFEQFKKVYKESLAIEQGSDNAKKVKQQKTGATTKDLFEQNYMATLVTAEYAIE